MKIVLDTLREHSILDRGVLSKTLYAPDVAGAWQVVGFARLFPLLDEWAARNARYMTLETMLTER
jgi:hypothetical protein